MRLDDAYHRLIGWRRYPQRFAKARDRAVDGIHLASAAGGIVQQHRGARVGNFAAEFSDVLDRIADIQADVRSLRDGDGFFRTAARHTPGIGISEDFADRQACRAKTCLKRRRS